MGISWDLAHHHLEKMSRINAYLGEATGEKDEIGWHLRFVASSDEGEKPAR